MAHADKEVTSDFLECFQCTSKDKNCENRITDVNSPTVKCPKEHKCTTYTSPEDKSCKLIFFKYKANQCLFIHRLQKYLAKTHVLLSMLEIVLSNIKLHLVNVNRSTKSKKSL